MKTTEEFFAFEKEKQKVFDQFYKQEGWEAKRITGKENKDYDCLIKKDGVWYKIEEKYRSKEWEDLAVETIQDTETNSPGWIYYTKAQYLFYGMGKKIYAVDIVKLRELIEGYDDKFNTFISKKGWGNTLNTIIPLSIITANKIGKRIL